MHTETVDPKVRNLIHDIAAELTLRSGSQWLVKNKEQSPFWTLADREGHEFILHHGGYGNENRIRVSGNWPKYRNNAGNDVMVFPRDIGVNGNSLVFRRNGRAFRGRMSKDSDHFNFRRVA